MKVILNECECCNFYQGFSLRPAKRSLKRMMKSLVLRVSIPIERGEMIIGMCEHEEETKSISFVTHDGQTARSPLHDMQIRSDSILIHISNLITLNPVDIRYPQTMKIVTARNPKVPRRA